MNTAADAIAAIKTERDSIHREIQAITGKVQALTGQLSALEAVQAAAAAEQASAVEALTAALEAGDQQGIEKARNRAAAASEREAKASACADESRALKAAIAALNVKMAPMAERLRNLRLEEMDAAALRLREVAALVGDEYRELLHKLGGVIVKAQALSATAERLGRPAGYAPPPYAMPSVIGESIGASGRVVIDLEPMRQRAMELLTAQLRAEGFAAV